MARGIDETGNVYGKWKVIEKVNNPKKNGALFRCRCECGHEQEIFQKVFIIKVCNVESECYLIQHNLFPLIANHKKVTLLGSQKEKEEKFASMLQ